MNIKGVRLMLILMCSVITDTAIAQTRDSGQDSKTWCVFLEFLEVR